MIEVVNSELVRPARATSSDRPSWKLSLLDIPNLLLVLRGTWVFAEAFDVSQLKESLAETLAFYPHLAGRMERGRVVHFTDEGVPFSVVKSPKITVQEVRDRALDNKFIDSFSEKLPMSRVKRGHTAPMTVRVTPLRDGTVLSLRCSHACLDGSSFYGMVDTWARIHCGRPVETPILDQSLLPEVTPRTKVDAQRDAVAEGWHKLTIGQLAKVVPPFLMGTLKQRAPAIHISPGALEHLCDSVRENSSGTQLSSNAALLGHLSSMFMKLYQLPDTARCDLVTLVDGRERFAGVPKAFAGNAAMPVTIPDLRSGESVSAMAAQIQASLALLMKRPSAEYQRRLSLIMELAALRAPYLPYDMAGMHSALPKTIYTNDFSRIPIYVDFGGAERPLKPLFVIPHDLLDPLLIWPAPPDVGGVEVYLTGRAARRLEAHPDADRWREECSLASL